MPSFHRSSPGHLLSTAHIVQLCAQFAQGDRHVNAKVCLCNCIFFPTLASCCRRTFQLYRPSHRSKLPRVRTSHETRTHLTYWCRDAIQAACNVKEVCLLLAFSPNLLSLAPSSLRPNHGSARVAGRTSPHSRSHTQRRRSLSTSARCAQDPCL
jgi:hypothetical protein